MEKKRNIVAIGEMVKIAKGHINSALPQVSEHILFLGRIYFPLSDWKLIVPDLCLS